MTWLNESETEYVAKLPGIERPPLEAMLPLHKKQIVKGKTSSSHLLSHEKLLAT